MTLADPQDELAIDELATGSLPVAPTPACYTNLANGAHFINVEKMRTRMYRKANDWVATGAAQKVPAHFLCQHCGTRHAANLDAINSMVFDYPFSFRKSSIYNDLLGILNGTPAAGDPTFRYNSISYNTEIEFWNIVSVAAGGSDKPTEKAALATAISSGTAKSTSNAVKRGGGE